MKKVAVTVAVLALGLAACAQDNQANNAAENDLFAENAAETDMNMAMNDMSSEDVAENALKNAGESIENAQEAVDDMAANTQ
ncbi:MAG: hypothetical protein ACR2JJ_00630 [Sphingomicrobium sp.]